MFEGNQQLDLRVLDHPRLALRSANEHTPTLLEYAYVHQTWRSGELSGGSQRRDHSMLSLVCRCFSVHKHASGAWTRPAMITVLVVACHIRRAACKRPDQRVVRSRLDHLLRIQRVRWN